MSRVFAYCRVSTLDQTTDNQIREIEAAGFRIEPRRLVTETVSGSSAAQQRPGFVRLLDRLERDDILVVTKLDRLGRNSIDVQQTVAKLADLGIRVHCLALGGVDLTSPAGRMTMGVIAAVAQSERDLLIERTLSGQARAKAEGVKFGRPAKLNNGERAKVLEQLTAGTSISAISRSSGASRATIMRLRNATTRGLAGSGGP
jgi:putative DNA-invertase from lambdoid prophage Rac